MPPASHRMNVAPSSPSRLRRTLCLAVLASLSLAAPRLVPAQQDPLRTLTGTVTDHGKEPLKGAIVEVENESTSGIVSYITEASGTFSFKRLSSNTDYRVTATYRGHRAKAHELSHFESNRNPVINFVIELD